MRINYVNLIEALCIKLNWATDTNVLKINLVKHDNV